MVPRIVTLLFLTYAHTFIVALPSHTDSHSDIEVPIVKMYETYEWTIDNLSWVGNPFDLIAAVTFVHETTGETHRTHMFYNKNQEWKFRFTGTRMGKWTYTTQSHDPELNELKGSVEVIENEDSNIKGFLTHIGNSFVIQKGNEAELVPYRFQVYMNAYTFPEIGGDLTNWNNELTHAYLDDAMDNGAEIIFFHILNQFFELGVQKHTKHQSEEPDIRTFEQLEAILYTVHQRGGRVHFWAWGDESRKWTPKGIPGGINGPVDKRLQRYIAARLGPLPGWSMGYGFDLNEWTDDEQRNEWANYLHDYLGWDHLLSTRGFELKGDPNNMLSYASQGGNNQDYKTSLPSTYAEVVEHREQSQRQAVCYEERHTYQRKGYNLDMDGSRRLLWWQSMAGGVGGFHGFYDPSLKAFNGYPYPDINQLQTHYQFWIGQDRLTLDMKVNNRISNGYGLVDSSVQRIIIYKEETDSLSIDLSLFSDTIKVIAVNTKGPYEEIELPSLINDTVDISLPMVSDWALVFELKHLEPLTPPIMEGISFRNMYLEGYFNSATQKMDSFLNTGGLIPLSPPFSAFPWNYEGDDSLSYVPKDMADWVLVSLRDPSGNILEQKACILTQSGKVKTVDGKDTLTFKEMILPNSFAAIGDPTGVKDTSFLFSFHHRSHLAVAFRATAGERIDPLNGNTPLGNEQMKLIQNVPVLYGGDYDGNGILNNQDYNLWKDNAASLKKYLPIDGDGNGIINNQDANIWYRNRSKLGSQWIQ